VTQLICAPVSRNGFAAPELERRDDHLPASRVRGLSERFESRLLPTSKRRTEEVDRVVPELELERAVTPHASKIHIAKNDGCFGAPLGKEHCRYHVTFAVPYSPPPSRVGEGCLAGPRPLCIGAAREGRLHLPSVQAEDDASERPPDYDRRYAHRRRDRR
jgi:hypothetical protein